MMTKFRSGEQIIVKGPAYVKIIEGKVSFYNKELSGNNTIVIPAFKQAIISILEDSDIYIKISENGSWEKSKDMIPLEWNLLFKKIKNLGKRSKIMILGDSIDSKEDFSYYIINFFLRNNNKVCLLDINPEISEISSPATISLALYDKPIISLEKAKKKFSFFIGSTDLSLSKAETIVAVNELIKKARSLDCNLMIINTDDWLYCRDAIDFKLALIFLIEPEVIIAIEKGGELEPLIRPLESQRWTVIFRTIPMSKKLVSDKKSIQIRKYIRAFANAKIRTYDLRKVKVYGLMKISFSDSNKNYDGIVWFGNDSLLVYSLSNTDTCIIDHLKNIFPISNFKKIDKSFNKNFLVGLYDSKKKFLGIGLLENIDIKRDIIKIYTNVEEYPSLIVIGKTKVNKKVISSRVA